MFRRFLASLLYFGIAILYLLSSGAKPDEVQLPMQMGIAFTALAAINMIDAVVNSNPNKDVLKELGEVKAELKALRAEIASKGNP